MANLNKQLYYYVHKQRIINIKFNIGSANGGLSFKEEDVKIMKDNNNSVLQWMERRRRTGFFMDEANPIFP